MESKTQLLRNARGAMLGNAEGADHESGTASKMPPRFSLAATPIDNPGNRRGAPGGDVVANQRPGGGPGGGGGACSASATGVRLGHSHGHNDGVSFGLVTPISVRGTDLANVLDTELVSPSVDHTGCFAAVPSMISSNSTWMAADHIPPDHHTFPTVEALRIFDANGGNGSISFLQMDLFKIPSCGITTEQDMPHSGYRIKHELIGTVGGPVKAKTTKTAEAVTIGSHSSTAGLTHQRKATNRIRR